VDAARAEILFRPGYVKNFGEVTTEFIQPAMDLIWNNQATAQDALSQATANAAPMLTGRWDR
jgi:hypothetical protein